MATIAQTNLEHNATPNALALDPRNYKALGDFLTDSFNKPDVRDLLIKTYGDQGITGFLTLTGAVNSGGSADQVEWFEEARRHRLYKADVGGTLNGSGILASTFQFDINPQKYDVLMSTVSGDKLIITSDQTNTTTGTVDVAHLTNATSSLQVTNGTDFVYLGNMYPQGSDQPDFFFETSPERRKNPYMIVKDRYEVNGSQATNIGYVNIGNGDYRWFMHGEMEARKRFMDRRELMMLFGDQLSTAAKGAYAENKDKLTGSTGYFSAIDARGIEVTGVGSDPLDSFGEFDLILTELDRQGAPSEYAMYLNRKQSLAIDDMLAAGIATSVTGGLPAQFGAFQNNADMAVQLGFKSFTRGGYSFHKHDFKLLNDPTLLGAVTTGGVAGAMVPLTNVADARTGIKAPALEMCYKEANGYSREMEHWVTGGGVLGHNNNGDSGKDTAVFHYRSEIALVTRAANQHVLLK